jgi:hypothetical protein
MTNDQQKRLDFNRQMERQARDMSWQARSFIQWRIAKNREINATDRYVEDMLVRELQGQPRQPGWVVRLFKGL